MMVYKRRKSNIVEKNLVVTGYLGDVFCCFTTVQEMAGGVFKAIGSVLNVYLNQGEKNEGLKKNFQRGGIGSFGFFNSRLCRAGKQQFAEFHFNQFK